MTPQATPPSIYRFGVFEVRPQTSEIFRKQVRIRLQEQPFRLLCLLLENPGEIVTKEGMRERLWPQDTFVEFDASLTVAIAKLRTALEDSADNPRFIETIPRKGYRFLAPVERIHDAEPSAALEQAASPTAVQAAIEQKARSFGFYKYVSIAAALIVLAGFIVFRWFRNHPATQATSKAPGIAVPYVRRSVAVIGFRNLHGRPQDEWLSQAFSEMLGTELADGGDLRVISDEEVAQAKRELPASQQATVVPMLERFHQTLGADFVVSGSYTVLPTLDGERLRLDVRVQNTSNGEIVAECATTRPEKQIFELASDAGEELRKQLNVRLISVGAGNAARPSLPSNTDAIRFYTEGRLKLWDFDFIAARDLLTRSIELDPDFPLAHATLASALKSSGFSAQAAAEAKRAVELSQHLSKEEQLVVSGSYHTITADWPAAQSAYSELFKMHPDNLQYGLSLALAQSFTKPSDALATLNTLRELPPPVGDDPRIDLREARVLASFDVEKAQAAAKRGVAKAVTEGSPLMLARGDGILCQLGVVGGTSMQEMLTDCEKAIDGYAKAGDHDNEARSVNDSAGFYFTHGDLRRSEALFRKAQIEFQRVGDIEGLAAASNNIGDVLLSEGKLSEARKLINASIPGYQAIGEEDGVSRALSDLGVLSREQGNLAEAEANYQQAKSASLRIDDQSGVAIADFGLGDISMDRGDLVAARKSYQASLDTRVKISERVTAAESRAALAELSIEEGHPDNAVPMLRDCLAQFRTEQQSDDEIAATATLIRALAAQGNLDGARTEIDREKPEAETSQNRLSRLLFFLWAAQVAGMSEHAENAVSSLTDIIRQARELGLLRLELEAELALAALEAKTGHSDAARTQVAALKVKAASHGFVQIQRKADLLR